MSDNVARLMALIAVVMLFTVVLAVSMATEAEKRWWGTEVTVGVDAVTNQVARLPMPAVARDWLQSRTVLELAKVKKELYLVDMKIGQASFYGVPLLHRVSEVQRIEGAIKVREAIANDPREVPELARLREELVAARAIVAAWQLEVDVLPGLIGTHNALADRAEAMSRDVRPELALNVPRRDLPAWYAKLPAKL